MSEYEILRLIWWALLGVLLMGFAVMDGFDLGVAILAPWVSKNDMERRIVINTVGPVWEGNQVWLILGAGAIFAAWPTIYAVSFSGFYLAMLLALSGLILRPVSFKYRSKIKTVLWRSIWDYILFISGLVPSLVFGVAIGNVLQGVPFHFDDSLRMFYSGSFWQLFTPFTLLCGLTSVFMLAMHGGLFLATKTDTIIRQRAIRASRIAMILMVTLFIIGGFMLAYSVPGYTLTGIVDHAGPSNPLNKPIVQQIGAWMSHYQLFPVLWLAPLLAIVMAVLSGLFAHKCTKFAFVLSSIAVMAVIGTVGLTMFPVLLPSNLEPTVSLLVWDASSSQTTLMIMLASTIIFLPIILLYTSWVYRIMRGKVTEAVVKSEINSY